MLFHLHKLLSSDIFANPHPHLRAGKNVQSADKFDKKRPSRSTWHICPGPGRGSRCEGRLSVSVFCPGQRRHQAQVGRNICNMSVTPVPRVPPKNLVFFPAGAPPQNHKFPLSFLGDSGDSVFFQLWSPPLKITSFLSPPKNSSFFPTLKKKLKFFWGLKKLVILNGAPV